MEQILRSFSIFCLFIMTGCAVTANQQGQGRPDPIPCTDAQCERFIESAQTWIHSNSSLPITRKTSKLVATQPSQIDAGPGSSILISYKAEVINQDGKSFVQIYAGCANVFSCQYSVPQKANELRQFITTQEEKFRAKQEKDKAEAPQKQEALRLQIEKEKQKEEADLKEQKTRRATSQANIRTVGNEVCFYQLGATGRDTSGNLYVKYGRGSIRGNIEQTTKEKIQIRVSTIKMYGEDVGAITYGGKLVKHGDLIWEKPSEWELCPEGIYHRRLTN